VGERLLHISFALQPTSSLSKRRRNTVVSEGFPFLSVFCLRALQSLYLTPTKARLRDMRGKPEARAVSLEACRDDYRHGESTPQKFGILGF